MIIFISPCVLFIWKQEEDNKTFENYKDDMMDARLKNCHKVEYTQRPEITNEIVWLICNVFKSSDPLFTNQNIEERQNTEDK